MVTTGQSIVPRPQRSDTTAAQSSFALGLGVHFVHSREILCVGLARFSVATLIFAVIAHVRPLALRDVR